MTSQACWLGVGPAASSASALTTARSLWKARYSLRSPGSRVAPVHPAGVGASHSGAAAAAGRAAPRQSRARAASPIQERDVMP